MRRPVQSMVQRPVQLKGWILMPTKYIDARSGNVSLRQDGEMGKRSGAPMCACTLAYSADDYL